MQIRGTYRVFPTGTAVSGATVELYDADDLVTPLTSTTTGADGTWTITRNLSPGKFYVKITDAVNSITRWMSSRDTAFLGPNSSYDINYALQSLGDGVCKGVLNEFTTTESALTSTVQTGAGCIKGIMADTSSNTAVVHDAHDADPRYDRIVLRVTRLGQTDEGKSEIAIIKGTAAASPTLPALTQSASVWEYELYEALVPATSGSLTLTDRRTYINQSPIARTAPTVTASSSNILKGTFNTAGVLSSLYSVVGSNASTTDGFFEAYVSLTVTSGTIWLAAYRDDTTTASEVVSSNGITGYMVLPVRIDYTAQYPVAGGSTRTLGIAAYASSGHSIVVHGYTGFLHAFARS